MKADPMIADLGALVKNLPKEMSIISNKVTRKGKSLVAKDVASELAVPQKVIKQQISTQRIDKTGAQLVLSKSRRIPLRDFKARQTKKGVSYKVSKKRGRKLAVGAFTGPRPGLTFARYRGRVFKRVGKTRLPIRQLYGPSPWGVFVKQRRLKPVGDQLRAELRKQMAERLRYRRLKAAGEI